MEQEKLDVNLALLAEMYNELRSHRDKEFQTFLFAFPIIGAGFLMKPLIASPLLILLTLFCGVVCFYIFQNHKRAGRIKMIIVSIQDELEANKILGSLNPQAWAQKPFHKHLGTIVYLLLIILEVVFLWLFALGIIS